MQCLGYETIKMLDVQDVRCCGAEYFGIWDVQDV